MVIEVRSLNDSIEYFTDRSSVTIVFKKMDSTRMKTSGLFKLQDDIKRIVITNNLTNSNLLRAKQRAVNRTNKLFVIVINFRLAGNAVFERRHRPRDLLSKASC